MIERIAVILIAVAFGALCYGVYEAFSALEEFDAPFVGDVP